MEIIYDFIGIGKKCQFSMLDLTSLLKDDYISTGKIIKKRLEGKCGSDILQLL